MNSPMPIDIGISEPDRAAIARGLSKLLADSYTLYLKTHNYHWNVTGPMFNTLHLMFEQQYTELAAAVDLIAERIRARGRPGDRGADGPFHVCGCRRSPRRANGGSVDPADAGARKERLDAAELTRGLSPNYNRP
jgi:Ferritin-like domain